MSHAHAFNARLSGFSHLLLHSNELQTVPKEKTTKLGIHQFKNIIVTKIILQANFWKDKTVCYKNYYKYETKLRKWEAYYSIYRQMVPVAGDSLMKEQILERLFINVVVGGSLIKEYY